jgi:uncharacterized Zn-finger protein
MHYSDKKVGIPMQHVMPLLECPHCAMKFTIHGVFIREGECGEDDVQAMQQAAFNFCPYCGKSPEDEVIADSDDEDTPS